MLEVVLLAGLASARLVRLIREDAIFNRPRNWVYGWAPDKLVEFLRCPWCVSAYTTAAMIWAFDYVGSVPTPFVVWLAAWWVAVVAYFAAAALSKAVAEE